MAWWTPCRTAVTTVPTRAGETVAASPLRYCSMERNEAVALAPEPAAVGLSSIVLMEILLQSGADHVARARGVLGWSPAGTTPARLHGTGGDGGAPAVAINWDCSRC